MHGSAGGIRPSRSIPAGMGGSAGGLTAGHDASGDAVNAVREQTDRVEAEASTSDGHSKESSSASSSSSSVPISPGPGVHRPRASTDPKDAAASAVAASVAAVTDTSTTNQLRGASAPETSNSAAGMRPVGAGFQSIGWRIVGRILSLWDEHLEQGRLQLASQCNASHVTTGDALQYSALDRVLMLCLGSRLPIGGNAT